MNPRKLKNTYLTPGPSELYFTIPDHIKTALNEQIGSISHRSQEFKDIFEQTVGNLRELMDIPDDFYVVFTSSASEIFERLIQNCVEKHSFHFVNGAFSKKFYDFSVLLKRDSQKINAAFGTGFDVQNVEIPQESELIALTLNETSTGVHFPSQDIALLREKYPNKIIALDAVSALPHVKIDFTKIDTTFFSVQKAFGLPAGLGVWIFNEKCLQKAKYLQEKGVDIGTFHCLPEFAKRAKTFQTPATPNVLGIYLLGKVAGDMLRKGIETIRTETRYKATLVYHFLEQHKELSAFVKEKRFQSETTLVIDLPSDNAELYVEKLKKQGIILGTGYGEYKKAHLRIANFPTHSKEIFERLVDSL